MKKRGMSRREWMMGSGAAAALGAMPNRVASEKYAGRTEFRQESPQTKSTPGDESDRARRMKWWHEARFGMFIHWGLYSVLGRHEWVMENEGIPVAEYEKLAPKFKPVPNAARAWAQLAKRAGMKYMVMTTKHHEGFCN